MLLYDLLLAVAAALFVVVAGLLGWSIVRRPFGGGAREAGQEDVRIELLWWALPTVLVLTLFLLAARV